MGQTNGLVGINLFPLLPCFPGEVAGVPTSRQPLFLLGVIRPEERDSGKWRGALDRLVPQPAEQSKGIQNCFLFSFPCASQLLRKTCPKTLSAAPSHPVSRCLGRDPLGVCLSLSKTM